MLNGKYKPNSGMREINEEKEGLNTISDNLHATKSNDKEAKEKLPPWTIDDFDIGITFDVENEMSTELNLLDSSGIPKYC